MNPDPTTYMANTLNMRNMEVLFKQSKSRVGLDCPLNTTSKIAKT